MPNNAEALNATHSIPGTLHFEEKRNGLVSAVIDNKLTQGRVYMQGAQVTHFQPVNQRPVLWLSSKSLLLPGKAIRGGIPVCWPWFGDHPDDPKKPAHGFVRTSLWEVLQTKAMADGATTLCLGLHDNQNSRDLWNHHFNLQLTLSFAATLHVSLQITNSSSSPFTCSGALHSYLQIGDCKTVTIDGLDGLYYLDKADNFRNMTQNGPVTIRGETDRIYLNSSSPCIIHDPILQRSLHIHKKGSNTTVIWNPWAEKSVTMEDMEDSGYRTMICVESANTGEDSVTLQPGSTHTLETEIKIGNSKK